MLEGLPDSVAVHVVPDAAPIVALACRAPAAGTTARLDMVDGRPTVRWWDGATAHDHVVTVAALPGLVSVPVPFDVSAAAWATVLDVVDQTMLTLRAEEDEDGNLQVSGPNARMVELAPLPGLRRRASGELTVPAPTSQQVLDAAGVVWAGPTLRGDALPATRLTTYGALLARTEPATRAAAMLAAVPSDLTPVMAVVRPEDLWRWRWRASGLHLAASSDPHAVCDLRVLTYDQAARDQPTAPPLLLVDTPPLSDPEAMRAVRRLQGGGVLATAVTHAAWPDDVAALLEVADIVRRDEFGLAGRPLPAVYPGNSDRRAREHVAAYAATLPDPAAVPLNVVTVALPQPLVAAIAQIRSTVGLAEAARQIAEAVTTGTASVVSPKVATVAGLLAPDTAVLAAFPSTLLRLQRLRPDLDVVNLGVVEPGQVGVGRPRAALPGHIDHLVVADYPPDMSTLSALASTVGRVTVVHATGSIDDVRAEVSATVADGRRPDDDVLERLVGHTAE